MGNSQEISQETRCLPGQLGACLVFFGGIQLAQYVESKEFTHDGSMVLVEKC